MSADPAAKAPAVPVRPRRAGRAAHARPRLDAPSAARPRDAAWVHLSGPSVGEGGGVRLVAARGGAVPRPQAEAGGRAPIDAAPAPRPQAAPAPVRYEWTDRGIAVLMTLVAIVAVLVTATLVSAFLAVSPDAPAPSPAAAATGAAVAPLRAG